MNMSKWELLAVHQSLLMYVIVRLDQGETEQNNFDPLMRATFVVRFAQVSSSLPVSVR